MKEKLLLPALIVAALTATPVFAQVQGGAFTASLFEGGYTFDGDQHLKTNFAHGVRLGYNLNGNWGVEGQFTYVPLKSTLAALPDNEALFSLRGDLLYHFMPESRFVPFVVLGGGLSRASNNSIKGRNYDGTLDYGAGVMYFLNDWVALRGDVRHILSFDTPKFFAGNYWSNYEYTAGLTFQFGGTRAAPPAMEVAKPVTVTGAPRPELERVQLPDQQPEPAQVPLAQEQLQAEPEVPASSPVLPAESAPATAASVEAQVAEAAGDRNGCKVNTISTVVIGPNGVEIISDLGIETYKVFKLSAPTRLVIDIFCATGSSNGKTLKFAVNRMGVSRVRVGTHPDKLRVVVDSPLARFPDYRVVKTGRGLKLLLKNWRK
jgi:opacity protein-like surface antigen